MGRSAKLSAALFAALLAATLVTLWWTRDTASPRSTAASPLPVDRRLFDTARQLAGLAETPAEQAFAREAARLSDHELDQAFASALREAAAAKPVVGGPLQQIRERIAQSNQSIAADQDRIAKLPKDNEIQIDLAKAQLALDQDELEDAQADLAREGGDQRGKLQRAMAEHQAAQRDSVQTKPVAPGETGTLSQQIRTWMALGDRLAQIAAARQQALIRFAALTFEHASLDALIAQKPAPAALQTDDEEEAGAMLARLRGLSDQRKTLTELDGRIQDCQQLATVYRNWSASVAAREAATGRLVLHSLSLVFGVLLIAVFAEAGFLRFFRDRKDRRMHQERFLTKLTVRLIAVGAILLIAFGTPNQTPTIIGLATAALTVVLRDFVVAFIGWFVLMARNGVRVGDWVEIKGISGEVIEIGLFKTVLLEMGTGHPTGRRVSFMNGYAIEDNWFNFSTAGQWLWDELRATVPEGADPYGIAKKIREMVERETEANTQQAEQDWKHITQQYGASAFPAKPTVDLRPGGNGLEVNVRYITRGPERHALKSKLFREIVDLLAATKPEPAS